MALVLADRVKDTTTTTGTVSVILSGTAPTGYQPFSVIGNGNTCYYCISSLAGAEWEVGLGTYSSTGPTLARTTVLASSNTGSLVNFSAGTKDVYVVYPAGKAVYQDSTVSNTASAPQIAASNGIVVNSNTVSTNYSIPSGSSAISVGPMTVSNGISVTVPNGSRWVVI